MALIHVLQPHIANQIAAGEVVERPASVVKELVENAIDAGSTAVTIEIESGGMRSIRVTDNGCGIAREDCRNAFLRHATSKIATTDDLTRLVTLGFRGEALASIASVSHVTMTTRMRDNEVGTRLVIDNGVVVSEDDVACVYGSSFTVEALFASVPARLKFLKSVRSEAGYIGDYLARMILARPDISFRYVSDGKTVYESYGDGDLYNALYCVYGKTIAEKVVPVSSDDGYLKIDGFVGLPEISRSNRAYQTLLVNGRYIRSYSISASVLQAYDTRIMIGRFPFYVLSLTLSPQEFDVNVHPTKLEVRFADESRVCGSVHTAVKQALSSSVQHVESALDTVVPKDVKNYTESALPAHSVDFPIIERTAVGGYRSSLDSISRSATHGNGNSLHGFGSGTSFTPSKAPYTMREPPVMNTFPRIDSKEDVPTYRVAESDPVLPRVTFAEPETLVSSENTEIIGCVFQGYWIIERGEMLYLIDQHAAHERRLYDQLADQETEMASQPLLIPFDVRLTPSEVDTLLTHREEVEQLGYRFENVGSLNLSVSAVPVLNGTQLKELYLHEVLEICSEYGKDAVHRMVNDRLMQSACKHAIKVGERISGQEIENLLSDYVNGNVPLTCPHGRPVIIRITKTEIEKMFRRIV